MRRKILIIVLFFSAALCVAGSRLQTAYKALAMYDYFKARKLFYKSLTKKKEVPYAAYGLALIYSRQDNPFFNLDSANAQVVRSFHTYRCVNKPQKFDGFIIDTASILSLARYVGFEKLKAFTDRADIQTFDRFLGDFYLSGSTVLSDAARKRDEAEFELVSAANKSRATRQFLLTHPQSELYKEADKLFQQQIYEEHTADHKPASYVSFLNRYPNHPTAGAAYEQLFAIYRKNADVKGLTAFVRQYPDAPQNMEAWKLLFSLTVRAYTFTELKKFLEEHPQFPLRHTILKELELNKLVLFPFRKDDLSGFVDKEGKVIIPAVYDEVTDFFEGVSVIHRGDSACFINKENVNVFNRCFSEAMVFRNGIAPVNHGARWHFINRLGQIISKDYDEINELRDGIYVVKSGAKYGALDQFGQLVIEPKFSKLGDFINGFAYYIENGRYGFVSKSGSIAKPEFEWISEFSDARIAQFRQHGKYGLINSAGRRVLDASYDLISRAPSGIFVVVKEGNYGFFHPQGCFVSEVVNDFQRDRNVSFYSDGEYYRFIKKGEQAIVNENGHPVVGYGQYEEVGFPHNGLIVVKKKKKYGYVDLRQNVVIPLKYTDAADFSDSIAVVQLQGKNILIDTKGTELLSTPSSIEKQRNGQYYLPDEHRLVNRKGETVISGVQEIQDRGEGPLVAVLTGGEVRVVE